jgi:hypothetical protein
MPYLHHSHAKCEDCGERHIPGNPTECIEVLKGQLEEARQKIAELEAARGAEDICGLCGQPGADKIPHPNHWPGERIPDTNLVHADCEANECARAHAALSDEQRRRVLGSL